MPINTLSLYLKEANQYHIPVLIRGLYTNKSEVNADKKIGSFDDTANRIFKVLKNENGNKDLSNLKKSMGGVLINPLLFRSFGINVVPALVVTSNPSSCAAQNHTKTKETVCKSNDFDVVYGNIPIYKQLKIISEKSSDIKRAKIASSILNKYSNEEYSKNE